MNADFSRYLTFDPLGELINSTNKLKLKCRSTTPILTRKAKMSVQFNTQNQTHRQKQTGDLEMLRSHSFDQIPHNTAHIHSNISNITIKCCQNIKQNDANIIPSKQASPDKAKNKSLLDENSTIMKEILFQGIEMQSISSTVSDTQLRMKAIKQVYHNSIESSFECLIAKVIKAKESLLLNLDDRIHHLINETEKIQTTLKNYSVSNQKINEENSKYLNDQSKIKTMHTVYREFIKKFTSDKQHITIFLKNLCISPDCSIPALESINTLLEGITLKCPLLSEASEKKRPIFPASYSKYH